MRDRFIQTLLLPFSLLFGAGIWMRNLLYSTGIVKSTSFDIPIIGVGNLTLGGAGKTPHVEYLIRLLSPFLQVATLSRGYKRKTKGFRLVHRRDNALSVGDEPLQYFLKYPHVRVAVSESRSIGIPMMLSQHPEIQTILLDDSYQHLSVTPGLNILLTEYDSPYSDDVLLPAGRLREWRSGASRADVIVVSKCPDTLSPEERKDMHHRLKIESHQQLFFSKYIYGKLYHMINGSRADISDFDAVILVSAIANENYLYRYVAGQNPNVHTMSFEDHHLFSPHEMSILKQQYDHLSETQNVAIISTEKDATRLILHRDFILQAKLPLHILPVQVAFLDEDKKGFDDTVKSFLINFKY